MNPFAPKRVNTACKKGVKRILAKGSIRRCLRKSGQKIGDENRTLFRELEFSVGGILEGFSASPLPLTASASFSLNVVLDPNSSTLMPFSGYLQPPLVAHVLSVLDIFMCYFFKPPARHVHFVLLCKIDNE